MYRYALSEIKFNLMALIKNRREVLEEKAAALELRKAGLYDLSAVDP